MKKALAAILLTGLVCGAAFGMTAGADELDATGLKIGATFQDLSNEFVSMMAEALISHAEAIGAEIIPLDGQGSAENQLQQVETFITDGCDAIILNPYDATGCVPCVKAAAEAGIPIVVVNAIVDNLDEATGYVGGDTVDSARIETRYMAEQLGGEGKVVVIQGPLAHSAMFDRLQGMEEVLEEYPDIEVVAEDTANWSREEALVLMENWLQSDLEFDGVIAQNDEMAIGALKAIQAAGLQDQILVAGIDAIADAIPMVENGDLICTVFQDAVGQGEGAVDMAVRAAQGEEVENEELIPYLLITKENVDDFK